MVIVETFAINPAPATNDGIICYDCIGSIDVNATPVLDAFRSELQGNSVLLNFSRVERVNSMGLSLLLKLFEDSEAKGIKTQVCDLNRMVSMLFKITGLGRFVQGAERPKSGAGVQVARDNPEPPMQTSVPNTQVITPNPSANTTLKFVANLQTGQQLSGWYLLNTYLQRQLERPIHLQQPKLGEDLSEQPVDLLFSKPFDACSLINQHGYKPLVRPVGEADEVVILMHADDERQLADIDRPKVVTGSKNSFVYILGRSLCDENDLDSEKFDYQFAGNEIKALQMLIKAKVDVLFMLKKTYEGLSSFARGSTRLIDESSTCFAYHFFCVAPYLSELYEPLAKVFTEMEDSEQGRQILADIQIDNWCQPNEGEIRMLQLLYDRYNTQETSAHSEDAGNSTSQAS